jgi:hypothetical protein
MKNIHQISDNIYITSDEEIKVGDWYFITESISKCESKYEANDLTDICKKIILTTDPQLIADGVQSIDNEFLEWFVNHPSCEEVKIESWQTKGEWDIDYKIIIPKDEAKQRAKNYMSLKGALEPKQIKCYCGHTSYCDCSPLDEAKQFTPEMLVDLKQGLDNAIQKSNPLFPNYKHLNKQETLEEFALKNSKYTNHSNINHSKEEAIILGAKWQAERMYSEEEVYHILVEHTAFLFQGGKSTLSEWFEQFKKK